jgi:acyl carrier protein
MDTEIFKRVKKFTSKNAAVTDNEITENTELENDLGVSGDDAYEFIVAFGKEFNVNISNFMAAEYFSPEGDPILPAFIRMLTGKKSPQRKILTIKHLAKAVEIGWLDEDVINNKEG